MKNLQNPTNYIQQQYKLKTKKDIRGHQRHMKTFSKLSQHPFFLLFIILAVLDNAECQQLPQNMGPVSISNVRIPQRQQISQSGKILSINLPQIKFQISSRVFLQPGQLDDSQIFDTQKYSKSAADEACIIYPTSLDFIQRSQLPFSSQILTHILSTNSKKQRLYILTTNLTLQIYTVDKINIKLIQQHQLHKNNTNTTQNNNNNNHHVYMLEIQQRLYVFMDQKVIVFDDSGIQHVFVDVQVQGWGNGGRLVGVGRVGGEGEDGEGDGVIWVGVDKSVVIYSISNADYRKINRITSLQLNIRTPISSVKFQNKTFFILNSNNLTLAQQPKSPPSSAPPSQKSYQLPTDCQSLQVLPNTLYLSCRYQRQTYLIEVLINQDNVNDNDILPQIALNQFYDNYVIEGVREARRIGKNLVALLGDQEIFVVNSGVARQVLIDLQDRWLKQYSQLFNSFGLIDIDYLDNYSTQEQSYILIFTQTSIQMITIVYEPPQLQCQLNRQTHSTSATILIQFNTTSCPSNLTLTPPSSSTPRQPSICSISFPYIIYISTEDQYEYKEANFILFLILTILIALVVMGLGIGVKIKRQGERVVEGLKRKIQRIKKQRQMKELKEKNVL